MDRKTKLAFVWAAIVIIASILICGLTLGRSDVLLPIFMGVTTLIYGPVCAILYLREVKNGVFTIDEEEEADE